MKNILIIDDDPDIVELLKIRLEADDFIVTAASDGVTGLIKAKTQTPDLVILDIGMPHIDGIRFIKEAKHIPEIKKIPILVLTGHSDKKEFLKHEGIEHYIVKPYQANELLDLIKSILLNPH